jgi:hypothetical protein
MLHAGDRQRLAGYCSGETRICRDFAEPRRPKLDAEAGDADNAALGLLPEWL